MSGLINITVQEERGQVAVNADIDNLAVVLGCTTTGTGLSSFYMSSESAIAGRGYGETVDDACQIIEQLQPDGGTAKRPCAIYTIPVTTDGSYDTINVTGVTGTSVATVDATVHPNGTYDARIRVVTGGNVGTAGITIAWSLDGGRTESRVTALGTANTYTITEGSVKINFGTGTLVAGDIVRVRTHGPQPAAADIIAALTALAQSSVQCGVVVCSFELTTALAASVATGKAQMLAMGKRCVYLTKIRLPDYATSETEAAWFADVAADYSAVDDDRIFGVAIYGLLTDAKTGRRYLRSALGQFAADVVRVPRAQWPDCPADRKMANVSLVDDNGVQVGHDEGPRGNATGLSNDTLGNRFICAQRLPDASRMEDVFTTVPWGFYAADGRIRNIMTARVCNAIEREAVTAGTKLGGADLSYIKATATTSAMLTETSRRAVHGVIFKALQQEFKTDIDNANDAALDTGLVQVQQSITVSGGNLLGITVRLAPSVKGYLQNLTIVLSVQQ